MERAYKSFFSLLICWLLASPGHAQDRPAQNILLIFNQPKYFSGDTAFFRGQLTTADLKPVSGNKLVNLKLVGSNNEVVLYNRVVFQNGSCANQLLLPKALVPDIYSLIAYTDENPQTYFQIPIVVANEKEMVFKEEDKAKFFPEFSSDDSNSLRVKIQTDKPHYGVRQKVNVQIDITNTSDQPVQSDNIISVVQEDLFTETPWQTVQQANNFTTSQSGSVLSNKSKKFPDYFSGSITLDSIPPSQRDSILITFYFTKNDFIYGLYADGEGNFLFPLFKEFGDEEIFYTLSRKGVPVSKARILLSEAPVLQVAHPDKIQKDRNDPYFKLAREREVILRSFNYYLIDSKIKNDEEVDDWMDTDFEVDMDKFESFPDMKEVLANIVQAVKHVKGKGSEGVRVFMQEDAMFGRRDPVYIINGMMTDDTQYFLRLDPAKVEKIGVLRSRKTLARFGALGKYGIVLVKTRSSVEDLKSDKILFIKGINKSKKFYSPAYGNTSQANGKTPDLRSTLYWNPQLISDKGVAKFSFYTGDAVGTFKIKINGIAAGNRLFSGEFTFQVQRDTQ